MFQEDIFPPCFAGEPSLSAEEWIAGENKERVMQTITKAGLGVTSGGGDSVNTCVIHLMYMWAAEHVGKAQHILTFL